MHRVEVALPRRRSRGASRPATPQARIQALVKAAGHQCLSVIDQLLAAGTPIDAFDEQWGGQAARIAARNSRVAAVRHLLARGAEHNRTALDWSRPEHHYDDSPSHKQVQAIVEAVTAP